MASCVALFPAVAQPLQTTRHYTKSQLLELAGDGFRIHETEHFRIAYDCSIETLLPHVGRLEGTYDAVLRFASFCRLAPASLPSELPILFYDQFSDFTRYARTMGMSAASVSGFFHPKNNIAAFVNTRNAPAMTGIGDELERAGVIAAQLRRSNSPSDRARLDALEQSMGRWQQQRNALVKSYNRFVLQHEAAHQILFNIGVHARNAKTPKWLIEGLACQFETPQSEPRGLLVGVNQARLGDLRAALDLQPTGASRRMRWSTDRLIPLGQLISDDSLFQNPAVDGTLVYAQSWALVLYLHRERSNEFAKYLMKLADRRPNMPIDAEKEKKDFAAAFGEPNDAFLDTTLNWILKLRFDPQASPR